uniref:NADH-ubiquinone oxidoreductase chain 2 n=1 Tax=Scirtothrips dorsalis TaxID=163899 RepID=A0A089N8Q4_SCIDO|nr:NADH dehydrogenase subunit 2 [Scirtothrips dorsalis]AIQ80999.1 NADH dehydrogenase subunit 2 [Scirtothrips dorsalis]
MKNSFNHQNFIFFISISTSVFLGLSSNSFLILWMAMEINLFSFIPLISVNLENKSEKSMVMYFLVQSVSSMIIFSSVIWLTLSKVNILNQFMVSLIFLGIFMKMGLFPFQFWVISVIESMSWKNCFILLTIQKIIPISFMFCILQKKIILVLCFFNSLIASISGLTVFSLRKIFSFSSMNHLTLLILCMAFSKKIFKIYFVIYTLMNMIGMTIMNINKMFFLQEIMLMNKKNILDYFSIITVFFSMAGIPPFLGFLPKAMILMKMMENSLLFLTLTILIFNTITSFFYLRLSYMSLILSFKMKKKLKTSNNMSLPWYLMMIFFPMALIL